MCSVGKNNYRASAVCLDDNGTLLHCLFFYDTLNSRPVKFNMKFRPSLTAQERLALLFVAGLLLLGLAARYAGG